MNEFRVVGCEFRVKRMPAKLETRNLKLETYEGLWQTEF